MPYVSLYKKRLQQRKWCRERRRKAVELKGGQCTKCSAKRRLEFHHREPDEKESHRIWSWAWKRVLAEIAKCDLLCNRCHEKETSAQMAERARHMLRAENGAFMTVSA